MANDRRLRISRMMDEVLGESYDDILHEERQREALQKEPTKVERLSKMLLGDDYEGPVTEKEKEVLAHMSPNTLKEMKEEALKNDVSTRLFRQKDGKEITVTVSKYGVDKAKDAFNDGDPDFNYEITVDGKTTQVTKKQFEKVFERLSNSMMYRTMYKLESGISTPIKEARNMGADHVR